MLLLYSRITHQVSHFVHSYFIVKIRYVREPYWYLITGCFFFTLLDRERKAKKQPDVILRMYERKGGGGRPTHTLAFFLRNL